MKKISRYLLLSIFTLCFAACNNDLEEKVYSDVTESSYGYDNAYGAMGIVYEGLGHVVHHITDPCRIIDDRGLLRRRRAVRRQRRFSGGPPSR